MKRIKGDKMKVLLGSVIGLFFLAATVTLGLFLTGHLVIVPQHQVVNYVNDNGKTMFSSVGNVIYYRVAFLKSND